MVIGQLSAEQAYARHDLIIRGEIGQAMRFLRAIQRVEGYLFRGQWQDGCCRRTRNFPAGVGGCGCGCSI